MSGASTESAASPSTSTSASQSAAPVPVAPSPTAGGSPWWRRFLGRRSDWHLVRPSFSLPRPGLHLTGPLAMLASVVVSWFAFAGATGEDGSVAFGLYIGAVSIVLMAWSFVLALRVRVLEPFFGGLDSMYRAHRWAGTLAVIAMFLHTSVEPEIEGGIRGASESLADTAEGLAGTGELMLYVLVGLSLIRWFPYRYWRWTHKLLGVPFVFASWHFFTAEKTYANGSAWGWFFGLTMVAGIVAWVARVFGRDMAVQGTKYRIASMDKTETAVELTLTPEGEHMEYEAGQFVFLKIQERGLSEPHPFTVAAAPDEGVLRFHIRNLGDWTAKLLDADLVGSRVLVEGPYGQFEPTGEGRSVWVAGGVGITPFLSATAGLEPVEANERPVLFYCVRSESDAMALDALRAAEAEGKLIVHVCAADLGTRFSHELFADRVGGPGALEHSHVAVCGPAGLVAAASKSARQLGAQHVEVEDFDIRQGFGPDLSVEAEQALGALRERVSSR